MAKLYVGWDKMRSWYAQKQQFGVTAGADVQC